MTVSNLGDVVSYSSGNPSSNDSAQGVVIFTPGSTSPLGTTGNPLVTQTSSLQTTADLTSSLTTINTATTTTLSTATASVRTRVYRMRIDVAAAQTLTFNAQTNDVFTFAAAGHYVYDFSTRPWFTTAVNTAFTVTSTTTAVTNIVIEFTKVA